MLKTDDESDQEEMDPAGRKVPILLREPGAVADDLESDDHDDEDDELRTSQLIFSSGRGFNLR